MNSVGVVTRSAKARGDWPQIFSRPVQGSPPTWSSAKYQPMSALLRKLTQLEMLRWLAAHLNLSVWPMTQFVMKPP